MVKVEQPGQPGVPTGQPPSITIEAPMAFLYTFTVTIQISNKPQQLPSQACREATLHALSANTGTIYEGNSSVDATGFPLNPGAAQDVHVDNLNKVWIYGTAGDKLAVEVEWGVGQIA